MNFALMFALALGIDYALFIVNRFRGALFGTDLETEDAVAVTMDTAGKAVLFSGLTVLISLSAVMLVPSPAFRSMALGIMLSVVFVLGATMTLLPAVLAKLGRRVDGLSLPWVHAGEHRSPAFARWAERLWRHPLRFGIPAVALLLLLSIPVLKLDTGMPSIKVVPESASSRQGCDWVQQGFGPGAPGHPAGRGPTGRQRSRGHGARGRARHRAVDASGSRRRTGPDPGRPGRRSLEPRGGADDRPAARRPSTRDAGGRRGSREPRPRVRTRVTNSARRRRRARARLPAAAACRSGARAGGGRRRDEPPRHGGGVRHSQAHLPGRQPSGLLGFESQGFLNAWGRVLLRDDFAISMDYTVFLLSSAKDTGIARTTPVRQRSAAWRTRDASSSPPRR